MNEASTNMEPLQAPLNSFKKSNRKNQARKPTTKNESRTNKLFDALVSADASEMDRMIRDNVAGQFQRFWLQPIRVDRDIDKKGKVNDDQYVISLLERS